MTTSVPNMTYGTDAEMDPSTIDPSNLDAAADPFERVFVTVGTTEFDELIAMLDGEAFASVLALQGCKHLTLQIGRGKHEPQYLPSAAATHGFEFECFRFRPSLRAEMQQATLIVSHAGI
jgi:beta-1,4-N-acetylglucosaminyltransferase